MNTEHELFSSVPNDIVDTAMLDRYLAGESSREERLVVDRWVAADAGRAKWFDVIRDAVTIAFGTTRVDAKRAQEKLERRIRLEELPVAGDAAIQAYRMNTDNLVRQRALGTQTLRIARQKEGVFSGQTLRPRVWSAGVALILGVMTIVIARNTGWRYMSRSAPVSTLTYTTGNGERATITLPDGGTVALNVSSRLDVPMDYMAGDRTVRLVGEGLFTVRHHDRTSFTVLAGSTTAKVLGTSFVVRRYATDTSTLVAVREGKVVVDRALVTMNQLAEVGHAQVPHVGSSDPSLFSFATGTLTLGNMPLRSAIVELNRWYDVDIRLGDTVLANRPLKGEFAAGSLSDLTAILEWTYNVRVIRDGRVLTLYPRQ